MKIITTFSLGFLLATQLFAKAPVLLVTPLDFQCRVERADMPEAEEKGQTPFTVSISGARGKFDWRLPLYRSNNGYNDVATAQIGHATTDRRGQFVIAVTTMEMARVTDAQGLVLEVRQEGGSSTRCPLMPNAIASREAASLNAYRSSVAR